MEGVEIVYFSTRRLVHNKSLQGDAEKRRA